MYARLISFSGADPEKRERAIETIRGTVIPMLRQYDGFSGYVALYDDASRDAQAIEKAAQQVWKLPDSAKADLSVHLREALADRPLTLPRPKDESLAGKKS